MRETHVPLESIRERLVRAVEEGSEPPSKYMKGSMQRHGLKLHTKKQ